MPLTDVSVRNAESRDKPYRLTDSNKLSLIIYPNGVKSWRLRYRRNGKETMLSLGNYPTISLRDARTKRDEINLLLSRSIDPLESRRQTTKRSENENRTLASICTAWIEERRPPVWSEAYYAYTDKFIQRNITPKLGHLPIETISPLQILAILKDVEKQGKHATAHRIYNICSQLCRYAVANGWIPSDPCRDLQNALAPVPTKNRAAIISPIEVGRMLLRFDNYKGTASVKYALKIAPLVFLRPSELVQAKWDEIDFIADEWRIPASRMKMKEYHIVPISNQTKLRLLSLFGITGQGKYLFPRTNEHDKSIHRVTINRAIRNMGYSSEELCAHGLRATASTLLNELGWREDFIERQLAHAPRNKIRAIYNRASYLPERRKMMQAWADYLDTLREQALRELTKYETGHEVGTLP
jgi:integrase